MPTRWNVAGTVLIACNCDWGCPCNFNARPTKGFCEGGWTWLIDEGREGDVALDGLALSIFCKWPGAIHEGNGVAISFIDGRAGDEQAAALTRLARGELGGPWGIFINTYSMTDPKQARYDFTLAEHRSTLNIGDSVNIAIRPITNPVTGEEAHPEILLPEGLVLNRAAVAVSQTFTVDDAFSFDHSGQYTAFGRFSYEGA